MLEDNSSAILFSHSNYNKIIEGVERFYNNNELSRKFTKQAHRQYWDNFSRQKQINRFRVLFQKLEII